MMEQGARSLADVAVSVGFADQPHFTRAFRTEMGLTPGGFCKAFR
jgi:AraC-like DNA-binding protein